MPPRMRTRSTGRSVAESLGGRTGVWVARGGKGRRPREGNDERVDDLNGQGNDKGCNQGNVRNQNGNVVNKNIQENVGNVIIFGALIDEAVRNGSIKKVEKRGNVGEPIKDRSGRDDNKRTRTGNIFASTTNPLGSENPGLSVPRNVNPVNARNPGVRACYECGSTDHVRLAYPRLNRAQGPEENHLNQVVTNNEGQGHGNQGNQARGRAFV
nr:hypothetical protein [Tanacetum cinerariifolium]